MQPTASCAGTEADRRSVGGEGRPASVRRSDHRTVPGRGRLPPSSRPRSEPPAPCRARCMFVGSALLRGEVANSLPAPHLSVGLAAQVAMDEALLAMAMTPRRFPLPGDYARVAAELAEADACTHEMAGSRTPAPITGPRHRFPTPTWRRAGAGRSGFGYDRLRWDSGFDPHPGEPGGDRWMAFGPNRTASAVVLRHPGGPRPWVIAVHGFCMGFPFMDFQGLQMASSTTSSG